MTDDAPIAAVLFDMDGTIVDTEPYWIQAETTMVEAYGGTWTHDDAVQLVGSGLWESAKVLQRYGVELDADDIVMTLTARVQELLDSDGVPWRPGARELLQDLRRNGVRTALVTMSIRSMAEQIVSHIPFPAFDLLVTGDEVERPKPAPDPYLDAAHLLEVDPSRCVAVEDSLNGLTSAVAAGTIAVGVPHLLRLPATPLIDGRTHTLWPSLQGKGYSDFVDLVKERHA